MPYVKRLSVTTRRRQLVEPVHVLTITLGTDVRLVKFRRTIARVPSIDVCVWPAPLLRIVVVQVVFVERVVLVSGDGLDLAVPVFDEDQGEEHTEIDEVTVHYIFQVSLPGVW